MKKSSPAQISVDSSSVTKSTVDHPTNPANTASHNTTKPGCYALKAGGSTTMYVLEIRTRSNTSLVTYLGADGCWHSLGRAQVFDTLEAAKEVALAYNAAEQSRNKGNWQMWAFVRIAANCL